MDLYGNSFLNVEKLRSNGNFISNIEHPLIQISFSLIKRYFQKCIRFNGLSKEAYNFQKCIRFNGLSKEAYNFLQTLHNPTTTTERKEADLGNVDLKKSSFRLSSASTIIDFLCVK